MPNTQGWIRPPGALGFWDRASSPPDGGGPDYAAGILCSRRAAWQSIDSVEERVYCRALVGEVVERIQSAESGLNAFGLGLIKVLRYDF